MTGELLSKLRNKWYRFVWDSLINNKSSILFQECSKDLEEVILNEIKEDVETCRWCNNQGECVLFEVMCDGCCGVKSC